MQVGLSTQEVELRLKQFGYNEVLPPRESHLLAFLKKFTGLTAYVIELSIVISFLLQKIVEPIVMFSLLCVNAILSYVQEGRADRAVNLLQKKITISAKALRDAKWVNVPSRELVPGDVVKIMLGDIVPADICVQEGMVMMDQSALTGESLPVDKGRDEIVYAGSSVTRGEAFGEVTATGIRTYYGKTTQLLLIGKTSLVIEKITLSLTKYLLVLDIIFIGVVALRLMLFSPSSPIGDILPLLLTLLIASVPVALPAMSTITLSLGALELARLGVIVRKLNAVEAAAMMDVACLDKTGTITENRLEVTDLVVLDPAFSRDELLTFAIIASEVVTSDPIDNAIHQYAKKVPHVSGSQFQILNFKPFDPHIKKSEVQVIHEGHSLVISKGAPQVIAANAGNLKQAELSGLLTHLAEQGSRALAISIQEGTEIKLVGILVLQDRPRVDSASLIAKLQTLDIHVKMITGDNVAVARTIAKQVGIGENVIQARDMKDEQGRYLLEKIEQADIIAEVVPEDKFHAIEVLQSQNRHVVGMTGDGVNDAPALHKAEVGIAVSNATDVARSAAQIFLSREGIQNIVDLVWSGRSIYRKIIIWVINKIIKTFQIVFFVSLATIFLNLTVVTAVQMLLILFLFDFVTISISADKVTPSVSPERWELKKMAAIPSFLGAVNVGESFLALLVGMDYFQLSSGELQAFTFYFLLISGLLNIFSIREKGHFWASKPRGIMAGIIFIDIGVGSLIVLVGIAMFALPLACVAFLFVFEVGCVLGINDFLKAKLI